MTAHGPQQPTASDAPALARWLIRTLCPAERLEELEGDLCELFEQRERTLGHAAARRAYWRDALGLCWHAARLRRTSTRSAGRALLAALRIAAGYLLMGIALLSSICGLIVLISGTLVALGVGSATSWLEAAFTTGVGSPLWLVCPYVLLRRWVPTSQRERRVLGLLLVAMTLVCLVFGWLGNGFAYFCALDPLLRLLGAAKRRRARAVAMHA